MHQGQIAPPCGMTQLIIPKAARRALARGAELSTATGLEADLARVPEELRHDVLAERRVDGPVHVPGVAALARFHLFDRACRREAAVDGGFVAHPRCCLDVAADPELWGGVLVISLAKLREERGC